METMAKKDIRREVLSAREAMTEREWRSKSRQIQDRVLALPAFVSCRHVLCYVNHKKEAETAALLEKCLSMGKRVYCPLVTGKDMDFYEILSITELREGFHGILEPPGEKGRLFDPGNGSLHNRSVETFMLLPGVAFDRQRHRIGYGGGYYDRYLQKEKAGEIQTAALAFSLQVRDSIPWEAHDIRPAMIVTEECVIK